MAEKIVVTASLMVPNGPSINVNRTMDVQAYEKIDVSIKTADADKVVELWPSANSGEVQLLAIASSWYGTGEASSPYVTYKVNDGTQVFNLDQPHLLLGNSSVAMLDSIPKQLKFSYTKSSSSPDVVEIQILVGHKVMS